MNVHKGHRQRVKEKYINNRLKSFCEHEVLELLLFYSIPLKDTNKMAHNILNHFMTLEKIFNSSYDELISSKKINKNTVVLLMLVSAINDRYNNLIRQHKEILTYNNDYELLAFENLKIEDGKQALLVFLNINDEVLHKQYIHLDRNTSWSKKVLEIALIYDATTVGIIYNINFEKKYEFVVEAIELVLKFSNIKFIIKKIFHNNNIIKKESNFLFNNIIRRDLRSEFIKNGFKTFTDYDILEILISFGCRKKNSNILAHQILQKIGSLDRVLALNEIELINNCNITEHLAILITLQLEINRKQYLHSIIKKLHVTSTRIAGKLAVNILKNYRKEQFLVICLDFEHIVIDYKIVSVGIVNEIVIYIRDIMEIAINNKAKAVIVAHNHPNNTLEPSKSDIDSTINFEKSLHLCNIELVDHIIVSNFGYYSFREEKIIRRK